MAEYASMPQSAALLHNVLDETPIILDTSILVNLRDLRYAKLSLSTGVPGLPNLALVSDIFLGYVCLHSVLLVYGGVSAPHGIACDTRLNLCLSELTQFNNKKMFIKLLITVLLQLKKIEFLYC